MKGNEVKLRVIKEAIREIDTEIDEKEYARKKLRDNYNFIPFAHFIIDVVTFDLVNEFLALMSQKS